eukprot:TRINITY_DN19604_c0_g1_i1.p1 TRINITY_DN19604_c0_g1~~TRINITY_DN19604_c0_g1_i1.p1  ORF type:complete len:727 (-),score=145.50 TRINITY_DN19604_c0_g1_i1:175-2355(-)
MAGTRRRRDSSPELPKEEKGGEVVEARNNQSDSEQSFSDFSSDLDGSDVEEESDESEEGEEGEDEDNNNRDDIEDAVTGYMAALQAHTNDEESPEADTLNAEESDSSEDEVPNRNTVGDIPLKWYDEEEHIGYDIHGKQIKKQGKKDQLDAFLARTDDSNDWRKVYDEYNDEEVELTKEEINFISRLRKGKTPHGNVNPHEPYVDWFDWDGKGHPLSNAPEPKRRFIPSKWEAKKVVKLVRAIRNGWINLNKEEEKPRFYLMWGDDMRPSEKMANGLSYIPPPKSKLPGHEESFNPSPEYVPTQEEINSYQLMFEEDQPKFIPKKYEFMRNIPAYDKFVREMFERCLDLYLCPRTRKKRLNIDPESLIPKLPKPKDLQPFPTTCFLEYRGHRGAVSCISIESSGQWLASGSKDGCVRIWEVETTRCLNVYDFGRPVQHIAWNPISELGILAVAVDTELVLLKTAVGEGSTQEKVSDLLKIKESSPHDDSLESARPLVHWVQHEKFHGIKLTHYKRVSSVSWHHKGDYFTTVAPDGESKAVLIHQLSKQQTQNPFKKMHGRVVTAVFHPTRPIFFVSTKTHVRIYNLVKQQLVKKLTTGLREVSSLSVHPGGDNLIVGSKEGKVCWFDMDLSSSPYRTLKNHDKDILAVAFHNSYPLFASCSDDCTAYVFHGMVYSDLLQNPLIVPLKVLRGHQSVSDRGILHCEFHPKQPWLFTAGADSIVKLYCN